MLLTIINISQLILSSFIQFFFLLFVYNFVLQSGFAGGSVNCGMKQYVHIPPEEITRDSENGEIDEEKPLDPRAGRVNVELPRLKFSCKDILDILKNYSFVEGSSPRSRKVIATLVQQ